MNESIVAAAIGAVAGVVPVVSTRIAGWFETRNSEGKRRRLLEQAKRHIDFLDSWYELQKKLLDPEKLEDIKKATSEELQSLRQSILEMTSFEKDPEIALLERPLIQRVLLAYRPIRTTGWLYRLLYYMMIGGFIAVLIDGVRTEDFFSGIDETGEFSFSFLVGEVIGVFLVLMTPLYALWYVANRSEHRAAEEL